MGQYKTLIENQVSKMYAIVILVFKRYPCTYDLMQGAICSNF